MSFFCDAAKWYKMAHIHTLKLSFHRSTLLGIYLMLCLALYGGAVACIAQSGAKEAPKSEQMIMGTWHHFICHYT